jgi:uncharacterized membrane protein YdbT with pleckstrin-like domain
MFWPSLALIIIAGATGFLFGRFAEAWQNLAVLAIGALGILLLWFFPLVGWLAGNYTITTRRTILRSGVLVRTRQEVLHSRSHDVTVRKSGLQTLFSSGDVLINTGLDRPVVLRDVPNADLVQAALHDLIEAAQTRLGRPPSGPEGLPDETTSWGAR